MLRVKSEVWKGLSGEDRLVIVDRLFALSRRVLEWKDECELEEPRAWAWYGKLDSEVHFLLGGLREVFGKGTGRHGSYGEMVSIDGQRKWILGFERDAVARKLDELGRLIGDWAEEWAAGKAVAWIGVGRLAEYVERIWDQVCWDGKGNGDRLSLTVVSGSGKSRGRKLR